MGTAASSFVNPARTRRRRFPADGKGTLAPRQAATPDSGDDRRQFYHRYRDSAALCAGRHDTGDNRAGLCRLRHDHGQRFSPAFRNRFQRPFQGSLSRRAAIDRLHVDCARVHLCRAGSRRYVPVHAVHRVQLLIAAFDPAADDGNLDGDDDRAGRAVPADRQADLDAAWQLSRALRHHAGAGAVDRALHVLRDLLQLDEALALSERAETQGSLQADRGARRTSTNSPARTTAAASCGCWTRKSRGRHATGHPARSR